ncbi:MAG: S8 family serine peptidase [Gaiellaceae bacterium]
MRLPFPAVAAALLVAAGPAAAQAPAHAAAAPGRVIVRFAAESTHAERLKVQREVGARTLEGDLPGGARALSTKPGSSVTATVAELRGHPTVAYAVPDYLAHMSQTPPPAFVPNDPGRGGAGNWQAVQWNLTGPFSVNAPQAWAEAAAAGAPGGRGVKIALIDSGVAYENRGHFRRSPDFSSHQFLPGHDFVDHDTHPDDQESHGTHVAGTLAEQTNNGIALTGLAFGAKIMALRVLDSEGNGDGASIARAIRYAAKKGATVINMSVEFESGMRAGDIPEVLSAIRYAYKKGSVMVAASGNEGDSRVTYPAAAPQVISVGATTVDGCQADYSNGGTRLDVVAPGGGSDAPNSDNPVDQQNCHPENRGRAIFQESFTRNPRTFAIVGFEGTSFATPHVTAIAALIIATKVLGPHPTPAQVKQRIEQTAQDLGPPGYDQRYGFGLVNAAAAIAR